MASTYTVGELAAVVTFGMERSMRKLLVDAGAQIDEYKVDPSERVPREVVIDLIALRPDRVGRVLAAFLRRADTVND